MKTLLHKKLRRYGYAVNRTPMDLGLNAVFIESWTASWSLRWRHNGRHNVSNHISYDCLLNRLFRRRSKKHQSSASLAFVQEIHRGPVNSPHKWSVTQKMWPFDDVIMVLVCSFICYSDPVLAQATRLKWIKLALFMWIRYHDSTRSQTRL